ncbi:hypothetical protein DFH06DRAFT_1279704 [Mycena polygramma]|nr:hypothetical protein DFH06DRAFT_1279704 [Mycena polygramma]
MTETDDPRGFQTGYNICNSTTENQDSLCQTMFVNRIDDFCLWAPGPPNSTISDTRVTWWRGARRRGDGTRIIPDGAITGLQFVKTPSYIQIAGTIDQAKFNIAGEFGGELDSGGQDGEGNPMGGLVYTNNFPSAGGNNATFTQAPHWSFFIGANTFCGKICDQTGSNPQGLCNNIYDRLGCDYNAPNNAVAGTFERCAGDDMTPVGTYVMNGQTSVYHQPAETIPINDGDVPYTATPAPTSNCVTYASSAIFTDGAAVTAAPQCYRAASGASGASGAATSKTTVGSGASTKAGSGASGSSTGSAALPSGSSGARALGGSVAGVVGGMGLVLAAL